MTRWCRRHTIGGDGGAIVSRRRDEQRSGQDALSREQELDLIDVLRGRLPDEFGLTDELWTRQSVAELIEQRYDLPFTPRLVNRYLVAWGLAQREPTERACRLCAEAVARWVDGEYPAILRSAQDAGAELYWVGRTRLHGVSPVANVLSALTPHGWVQFMITSVRPEPRMSRDFLLRLSGRDCHPVHVVVDGSWASVDWPRRLPPRIVRHALPSCGRGV